MNIGAFNYMVKWDKTKVDPALKTLDGTVMGAISTTTASTTAPYVEYTTDVGTTLFGYNFSPYKIVNGSTTCYFDLGFGNQTGSNIVLTSGQELTLFTVYFKPKAGQTVDANTFTFYSNPTGSRATWLTYASCGVYQSIARTAPLYLQPDEFLITYEAAATPAPTPTPYVPTPSPYVKQNAS